MSLVTCQAADQDAQPPRWYCGRPLGHDGPCQEEPTHEDIDQFDEKAREAYEDDFQARNRAWLVSQTSRPATRPHEALIELDRQVEQVAEFVNAGWSHRILSRTDQALPAIRSYIQTLELYLRASTKALLHSNDPADLERLAAIKKLELPEV